MFKSVAVSVFVVVISLTSVTALAATEETVRLGKKSLSVENTAISKQSIETVIDIRSAKSGDEVKGATVKSQDTNTSEPTLFSGWVLAFTLLGFLMMSNRRSV